MIILLVISYHLPTLPPLFFRHLPPGNVLLTCLAKLLGSAWCIAAMPGSTLSIQALTDLLPASMTAPMVNMLMWLIGSRRCQNRKTVTVRGR